MHHLQWCLKYGNKLTKKTKLKRKYLKLKKLKYIILDEINLIGNLGWISDVKNKWNSGCLGSEYKCFSRFESHSGHKCTFRNNTQFPFFGALKK